MAVIPVKDRIWEVWQGPALVCSAEMRLTRQQAENKVTNERRLGNRMVARRAICICDRPYNDYGRDNPYCTYPHARVRPEEKRED